MKLYIYKSGNEFYLNYYYQTQSSSLSNLINIYIYDSSYMNENLFFLFSFSFSTKSTISAAPSNPPACSRIEKIARDYFAALLNFKVEFFFLLFPSLIPFPRIHGRQVDCPRSRNVRGEIIERHVNVRPVPETGIDSFSKFYRIIALINEALKRK